MNDEMMKKMLMKKGQALNIKIGWGEDDDQDPEALVADGQPELAPMVKDKMAMGEPDGDESPEMAMKMQALKAAMEGEMPEDEMEEEEIMMKKSPSFKDSVKMNALKGLKKLKKV